MMDPSTIARLAQIRQQEILDQAAIDRESSLRPEWARLIERIRAFLQRRARDNAFQPASTLGQMASGQMTLDECPCE